jgi:hypothetical protein
VLPSAYGGIGYLTGAYVALRTADLVVTVLLNCAGGGKFLPKLFYP